MSRGTGVFKQQEFLEKLRRLEQEVASAKAAADEMARKAIERSSQTGGQVQKTVDGPAAPETKTRA